MQVMESTYKCHSLSVSALTNGHMMCYMLTLYIPGYLRGASRADKEGGESFKSLFVEVGPVLQARPLYTEMYYVFGGKRYHSTPRRVQIQLSSPLNLGAKGQGR